MQELTIENQLF